MKRHAVLALTFAMLLSIAISGCSAPAPQRAFVEQAAAPEAPAAGPPAQAVAEAPAEAPPAEPAAQGGAGLADLPSPYADGRKIIKNGDMTLLVGDTDSAIDRVTLIAVAAGGYIVSSETEERDGAKYARMSLGVPVDQFEETQRKLRSMAIKVLRDTATGEDVTDQYVDLQAKLTNLEATQARVRAFLDEAETVEEALKVNAELSEIEGEIEQVKGRMNYLKDRSAFSSLAVSLEPQLPTPTPTASPTPTPTPTPLVFAPGETASEAFTTLGNVTKTLGTALIQFTIVLGPFILLAVLIGWGISRLRRRRRAALPPPVAPATPATPPE
jgi:hypothetical protein